MELKPATTISRGERNILWIERYLRIPEGEFVGQPVRLRDWQKEIIRGIYDRPVRRAFISFGRKNAKTTLSAFLLLLHLCGPEGKDKPNSQLYSAAQSRDQAALLFGLAAKMVRMSPQLVHIVTPKDSQKQLHCPKLGTVYRALSAEASTAYGLSPVFVVHDELGQVRGDKHELYDALETATGAHKNPLSIVISTQAPTDQDLLSILLDDALQQLETASATGRDPRVFVSLHTTPLDDDPFTEESIRKANPAFGDFLNAEEILAQAQDAQRMPSKESEFRNLILNQRVEATSPFVSRSVWKACGTPVASIEKVPIWGGLDLSAVADLTALVLIGKHGDVWHVEPTFWLPADGLADKGRQDHVPYDRWARDGYLKTCPGKTVDYDYVAHFLVQLLKQRDVRKIAFDAWNFKHLRPALLRAGMSEPTIERKFEEFRQGYQSMSPALHALEDKLINHKVAHGNHPVLSKCVFDAVIDMDPAGNRKFTKAKSTGRIDGAVALAMAMGVALFEPDRPFTII